MHPCVPPRTPRPHFLRPSLKQLWSIPARRAVESTVFCDLGFEETTEELAYLANADCNVAFKFPLPPRSAVFRYPISIF